MCHNLCSTDERALSINARYSLLQYVNDELFFAQGSITINANDNGYLVRYFIESGVGSVGGPLLEVNNAVVAVHLGSNANNPNEKVGQTLRSMVAHFFMDRPDYTPG